MKTKDIKDALKEACFTIDVRRNDVIAEINNILAQWKEGTTPPEKIGYGELEYALITSDSEKCYFLRVGNENIYRASKSDYEKGIYGNSAISLSALSNELLKMIYVNLPSAIVRHCEKLKNYSFIHDDSTEETPQPKSQTVQKKTFENIVSGIYESLSRVEKNSANLLKERTKLIEFLREFLEKWKTATEKDLHCCKRMIVLSTDNYYYYLLRGESEIYKIKQVDYHYRAFDCAETIDLENINHDRLIEIVRELNTNLMDYNEKLNEYITRLTRLPF